MSLTTAPYTVHGHLKEKDIRRLLSTTIRKQSVQTLILQINCILNRLTAEDVEAIVDLEKPDGAVVQFGGQTAIKLTEALIEMGVPIFGTSPEKCRCGRGQRVI